jgi:type II secretory pathway component GspD/PulD (secretin)
MIPEVRNRQRKNILSLIVFVVLSASLLKMPLLRAADEQKSQRALKTLVTYSGTEKPIDEVLMALAEQANIDIVKNPMVTGNVTVKLTAVPLEEALDNILAAHNYTYVATENMIRVVTVPEVTALEEKYITRIYRLTYTDVNDVAAALNKFVSSKGKVAINTSTSHIMVTDTPDRVAGIDKFIEQIDQITQQVLVEVRIYDVTINEGFELSPEWYFGRNTPVETTKTTVTDVESAAPTSLTTTKTTHETGSGTEPVSGDDAMAAVKSDETMAYIPDSYRSYSKNNTTVETKTEEILNPDGYDSTTQTTTSTLKKRKPFVSGTFDKTTGGTLNFSILDKAVDLEFALNILHTQVESKLLANPRVLVLDNESANFEIVRELPYREMVQVAREAPMTYTAFKNVGIHLKVTPHIARDGMIKLHIAPEFGVVVSQSATDGAPTIDTRKADTIALIGDGQTIVMGGLRQKTTSKEISKVPVLADLPLLGGLFKSETEAVKNKELVIFITAQIINKPQLSGADAESLADTNIVIPKLTGNRLDKSKVKPAQTAPQLQKSTGAEDVSNILQQVLQGDK